MAETASYHHGDLRRVLVETAATLISEHGPQHFSLAEVSRRAGVSVAAPYRHFANREALVAAVAAGIYARVTEAMAAGAAGAATPADALVGAAEAYVRYAAEHPQHYELLFRSGLDKHAHPEVLNAALQGLAVLRSHTQQILRDDVEGAERLATALAITAQGYATLLLDGLLGPQPGPAERSAVEAVAAAARALLTGRRHFASS